MYDDIEEVVQPNIRKKVYNPDDEDENYPCADCGLSPNSAECEHCAEIAQYYNN